MSTNEDPDFVAWDRDADQEDRDANVRVNGAVPADGTGDTVYIERVVGAAIGPIQIENEDYGQAWVFVPDGDTLLIEAWGAIDSDENSPTGLKLAVYEGATELATADGVAWEDPDDPIAEIEGPAHVYIQLINETGEDLTADSTGANWAAANYDYERD